MAGGMVDGIDGKAALAAGMDPDRLGALVDHLDRTYLASGKLPQKRPLTSISQ